MTKKDYELIAGEIKRANDKGAFADSGLWYLTHCLGAEFERDNPRFDRNKFLQACGMRVTDVKVAQAIINSVGR